MKYIEFRRQLKDFTVFSLKDVRRAEKGFYRRRLNEWQDKGYIKKVFKGYYIFSDLEIDEGALFEIANRIYDPSYVSFETALSYYGMIPEAVYGITSASTRKTCSFKTPIAEFAYRTVKPRLFFGYNLIRNGDKCFKIASPEKAIFDYFYINSSMNDKDGYESLRVNRKAVLKLVDEKRLSAFLKKGGGKALAGRIKLFMEFVKNA